MSPVTESARTKLARWRFNYFPAYRRTGARITYIASDWSDIHIELPLNWKTRNYVGTIFGGSMYAAVDPIYMIMLIKLLGSDYVVWDKEASIRFKRPGRTTLYARFTLSDADVADLRTELESKSKVDRVYDVDLTDRDGAIFASIRKTIHIRRNRNV